MHLPPHLSLESWVGWGSLPEPFPRLEEHTQPPKPQSPPCHFLRLLCREGEGRVVEHIQWDWDFINSRSFVSLNYCGLGPFLMCFPNPQPLAYHSNHIYYDWMASWEQGDLLQIASWAGILTSLWKRGLGSKALSSEDSALLASPAQTKELRALWENWGKGNWGRKSVFILISGFFQVTGSCWANSKQKQPPPCGQFRCQSLPISKRTQNPYKILFSSAHCVRRTFRFALVLQNRWYGAVESGVLKTSWI